MATSKHRKNHKKKLAQFKQNKKAKLNNIMSLTSQLEQEISKLTPPEPSYPTYIRTGEPTLKLTGYENNENYDIS
jgi:hypothetical protein